MLSLSPTVQTGKQRYYLFLSSSRRIAADCHRVVQVVFCSSSSFSEHTCPQLCSSLNRTAPLPPGVCALLEQPALLSLCAALGRRAVSRRHLVMTPTDTEAYYKLTGPLLGKFNQMPKKCICVFNIFWCLCTGYVVAVKSS